MEIKEKLQPYFDKDIVSISTDDKYYYVILDDGDFVKTIYRVDLENKIIETNTIAMPKLLGLKGVNYKKDIIVINVFELNNLNI